VSDSTRQPAPALRPPAGVAPDWEKKINQARAARRLGKSLREGKPATFRATREMNFQTS
jgi:hypothetical protein